MPPNTPRKPLIELPKDAFKIFDSDNKGAIALDVVKIILELLTGKKKVKEEAELVMTLI